MAAPNPRVEGPRLGEAMARVHLSLENLEFVLGAFLRENDWLDPRTRELLIAVRESLGLVALSARALSDPAGGEAAATDG